MKILKIVSVTLIVYAGIVALFESFLGFSQPFDENNHIVITTFNSNQIGKERVVSLLESGNKIYVAANHWPRAWYRQALLNPSVEVTYKGEKKLYLAVPVQGKEHEKVNSDNAHTLTFRILTGFPPRYFLRLEPKL